MRRPFLAALGAAAFFIAVSGPLCAKTARTFDEKVTLDAAGNASVVWTITGLKDPASEILLPWNFTDDSAAVAVAPSGRLNAAIVSREGAMFLRLSSPGPIDCDSVTLAFDIPGFFAFAHAKKGDFGNYVVKKKFVNTTLIRIDRLSSEFYLPAGFDIASVEETLPEKPAGESASPFDIIRRGDRTGIAIALDSAGLGDAVYFRMKIKSSEKSPLLLILFVCCGIAYLVMFRDTVFSKKAAPSPDASH